METLKVIALTGYSEVGKSEIALHLIANHNFILVKFVSTMKDMLRRFGLSEREIEGDLKKVPCAKLYGKTPQYAMQTLGTEWGRNLIHQDLWVYDWEGKVTEELLLGHKVVCDDCRFENEESSIRVFPSQIWRVLRKDIGAPADHTSETELNFITPDRTIKNYGTLGELKTAVDSILANYDPSH